MLATIPSRLASDPALEPFVAMFESALLTPAELARHWRYSEDYLSNMRRAQHGPSWLKLTGAVRYRASEVLAWELRGTKGPLTLDRLSVMLATVQGLSPDMRRQIEARVAHLWDAGK